jgi:23S rRNA (guanine2445-N2)-methyltransferase / 23S rRNA (guanine2069-N7)-methyltransferase
MARRQPLIATAALGTEDLCAAELRAFGFPAVRILKGAVEFKGTLLEGLKACLGLRTGMRVLLPIAQVPAPDANGLYEGLKGIPWADHLTLRSTFAIDVSGESEGLTHTLFVAQKTKDAIVDVLRERLGGRPSVDRAQPDVRVVLHLHRGQADVSLDLAGDSLHRRGYRRAQHSAQLKETLAAAVLLAAGYSGEKPVCDPMCGSGTLAIEAALISQNRPPNLERRFGCERWPSFTEAQKESLALLRAELRAGLRPQPAPILASDWDPEAVEAARSNARAAGVRIEVREADARELVPLSPPGLVVANPPYGGRIGGGGGKKQLKSFYHALGARWKTLAGHEIAVLSGAPEFESAFGLRPRSRRALFNGPLRCELLGYRL